METDGKQTSASSGLLGEVHWYMRIAVVVAGAESFSICAAATSGFPTTLFAFNCTVGRLPA